MFLLRIFSGLTLIYYQGSTQFSKGWAYLWGGASWELVDYFVNVEKQSVPVAVFLSILTAVFYFFSPLLLTIGFLSRLSALVIFIGLIVTLSLQDGFMTSLSSTLNSQSLVLYFLICIFFILNGGGMMAVDRLFDRRRGKFRQAGNLYA